MLLFLVFSLLLLVITAGNQQSVKPVITSAVINSRNIDAICCDIDGTILDSNHELPDSTFNAIKNAIDKGYKFFPCTGRSRQSFINAVSPKLVELLCINGDINRIPGVFQQGLMVYNYDGNLVYERLLDNQIVTNVVEYCAKNKVSVIAYCGDKIYCQSRSKQTDKIVIYHEPIPDVFVNGLENLVHSNINIHKLIILDEEDRLQQVRDDLTLSLAGRASLTKAVDGMLEILPYNSNKGEGVIKLLQHCNIDKNNVIAFGDGENDVEMLIYCDLGVAVQNCKNALLKVCDYVTPGTNDDFAVGKVLDLLKPKY
jgi:hypothetical protein